MQRPLIEDSVRVAFSFFPSPLETEALESDIKQTDCCGGAYKLVMGRMERCLHALCLEAAERLGLCDALVVARVLGALQVDWPGLLFYNYSIVHSYIVQ